MLALFLYPQYARKEVNAMPYIPKDQIAAAREMDLLTYLRRFEPQELVHVGGNTYATRTHDSLKISNGKWCWWSRNIGGTNALDYLTTVEGVSFLDAVQRVLGEPPHVPPKSEPTAPLPKTEFKGRLPYLERREIHPEKYKLPPGSYSGTYAVKPLLPESVTTEELRKYYIESFRDIPDIVSTREAAELTGATASTVAKWIRTKKLKALSHGPAFIIPKVNLIDFICACKGL